MAPPPPPTGEGVGVGVGAGVAVGAGAGVGVGITTATGVDPLDDAVPPPPHPVRRAATAQEIVARKIDCTMNHPLAVVTNSI